MKFLGPALATALLMTSGAAAAQSAADAQCLILSNAFSKGSKNADQQKAAEASLYFYLGRVGDRMTAVQLKRLLDEQAKTITDKTAGETMNKCIQAIQTKVELLRSFSTPAKPQQPSGR